MNFISIKNIFITNIQGILIWILFFPTICIFSYFCFIYYGFRCFLLPSDFKVNDHTIRPHCFDRIELDTVVIRGYRNMTKSLFSFFETIVKDGSFSISILKESIISIEDFQYMLSNDYLMYKDVDCTSESPIKTEKTRTELEHKIIEIIRKQIFNKLNKLFY